MAILKVLCSMNIMTDIKFKIVLKSIPDGCVVLSTYIKPDKTVSIPVKPLRYQLEITNNAGLSPLKAVKYYDFSVQSRCGFNPVYNIKLRNGLKTVTFYLRDKSYDNITSLNGGITVCQKTTP